MNRFKLKYVLKFNNEKSGNLDFQQQILLVPLKRLKVVVLSFSDIFLIDNGPLAKSSKLWPIPLSDSSKLWPIPQNCG